VNCVSINRQVLFRGSIVKVVSMIIKSLSPLKKNKIKSTALPPKPSKEKITKYQKSKQN